MGFHRECPLLPAFFNETRGIRAIRGCFLLTLDVLESKVNGIGAKALHHGELPCVQPAGMGFSPCCYFFFGAVVLLIGAKVLAFSCNNFWNDSLSVLNSVAVLPTRTIRMLRIS
jgi:hypothetical protein